MINFISHENFPDDPYIKEIVYLQVNSDARYGYIRKATKNGNFFWSPMGCGVIKNGEKKFFDGIELDSNFLKKDILAFLEARSWECKAAVHDKTDYVVRSNKGMAGTVQTSPIVNLSSQASFSDELPF